VVAALAVLAPCLGAGAAAAAPGNGNAPDDAGAAGTTDGEAGPPSALPGPVPEFVGEIHDTVRAFLDRSVEALGGALGGLTPGGEGAAPGR
jgi:hypothetical protein